MTQFEAEQFLFEEARLLDQRHYQQWRELFGDDGIYWVPANDGDADPQINCSIIYAQGQQLDDRLERAQSGYFWADQPPIRTIHTVSNVSVQEEIDGSAQVVANQVIYLFRENDQRRDVPLEILPASSVYTVVNRGDYWGIKFKKLLFLQADGLMPLLPAFI